MAKVQVWIDQDLCTGDGLCTEIAPEVFGMHEDGLAYTIKDGKLLTDPGGVDAVAPVIEEQIDAVVESAEECPGECIFVEVVDS